MAVLHVMGPASFLDLEIVSSVSDVIEKGKLTSTPKNEVRIITLKTILEAY